ncbi:MAG TPA: hypothetical protein VF142_11850 [Longimicrobium sp.]
MRKTIHTLAAALVLGAAAACGGSDEGDVKDVPGVDASGTADTELFTQDPDTQGVPTAAQGGTTIDSVRAGTPGTTGTTQSP